MYLNFDDKSIGFYGTMLCKGCDIRGFNNLINFDKFNRIIKFKI